MSNSKHIQNFLQLAKMCRHMAVVAAQLGETREANHMREMALEYCLEARQLKRIDELTHSQ